MKGKGGSSSTARLIDQVMARAGLYAWMWRAQARDHCGAFAKTGLKPGPAAEVGRRRTAAPAAAEWRKTLVPAQQNID
jgi:hypothetical protein